MVLVAAASCKPIDFAEIAAHQIACADTASVAASLVLRIQRMSVLGTELLCDTSRGRIRPLVPLCYRQTVFAAVHGLAHPGWATRRLISFRFVWRGMAADINRWCRDCQNCSSGKITRQPAAAPVAIEIPAQCFSYIHVDLVGPLPVSAEGFNYVFTMIDRSTRGWKPCR